MILGLECGGFGFRNDVTKIKNVREVARGILHRKFKVNHCWWCPDYLFLGILTDQTLC